MKSGRFSLQLTDFTRGLLLAFATAFATAVGQALGINLDAPGDTFNLHFPSLSEWVYALKVAGGAAVGYLIKNYLTATNLQAVKTLEKATDAPIVISPKESSNTKP